MKFQKPYYLVTFVSQLKLGSTGYEEMSEKMLRLSEKQEGFLGIESVRDASGRGVTVSYWKSLESIKKWKDEPEHIEAQNLGKSKWYESFSVEISRVE